AGAQTMPSLRVVGLICVNNATSATPVPRKLWLIWEGELSQAGHQRRPPSCASTRLVGTIVGFCRDSARIAQILRPEGARPGGRARIQKRRSRGLSAVKGTACSTRAKYSSSSFSASARVTIGAPQFTDAIASSAAMKVRAILAVYWVEVIGVAPLEEFCD